MDFILTVSAGVGVALVVFFWKKMFLYLFCSKNRFKYRITFFQKVWFNNAVLDEIFAFQIRERIWSRILFQTHFTKKYNNDYFFPRDILGMQ